MKKIKLGDVLTVKRGMSLSGEFYSLKGDKVRLTLGNFDYPGGGFKENTAKEDIFFTGKVKPECILKKGDIITPLTEQVKGLLGETAFIPESNKYIQSGDIGLVLVDESKIDKNYAYYLLSSAIVKKQLSSSAQQTKIRHTSPVAIMDCQVWIPEEISSQKNIGGLLSSIDKKINNNKKICSELESLAKLIYDYWFVQFDFPDENGRPYKSSGGKMVWNEELKREIPEGWDVDTVGTIISKITTGLNPRQNFKLNDGGKIRYITVKNLNEHNSIDFTSCDYVDEEARKIIHRRSEISKGDILFASIAPLGRCYYIQENPKDWDINESVFCIHPKENSIYLFMVLTSNTVIKKMEMTSTGSIFKGIRIPELQEITSVIPQKKIIDAFEEKLAPLFEKMEMVNKENAELTSLREFILPMLMNGQVTIKDQD